MSKNLTPSSGPGGLRGDVSFIRATPGSGPPIQNVPVSSHSPEKFSPHQIQSLGSRSSHDVPIQPHLYHQHHLQPRLPQQQHTQQPYLQPYPPEHMESQPYPLKHPHGAGGASGDPIGRVPSHTGVEGWSDREEALATELEEAKIRVAQMEKTMRWWSDCTSNWREKWNKARNERNKAREENRLLRAKLEAVAKEISKLKREKKDTSSDLDKAQDGNMLSQTSAFLCHSQEKLVELSEKEKTVLAFSNEKESESFDDLSETSSCVSKPYKDHQDDKYVDDTDTSATHERSISGESLKMLEMSERLVQMQERQAQLEQSLAQSQSKLAQSSENIVEMQRRLDEANNTVQSERMENCSNLKIIERLQKELSEAQSKLSEEAQGKQDLKMQFEKLKEQHHEEISRLTSDLEEESFSRTTMDKRVTELRRELERIQAENASEWAKREHLESDKLALERDNKKLRLQIADLEEEIKKHNQASTSAADLDLKTLQLELFEKSKELSDLKHVHSKLKKALTERNTELEHTRRRAEMYEAEVRKLRSRVDELKHDLGVVEDEVDKQSNATRKAQRANDELQAQVESLQVQVNHLQSRLRRNTNIPPPRSTSLKSLTLEDSAELVDIRGTNSVTSFTP